jgi:hypothetical protein
MSDATQTFGDDDNGGSRPNYLARRLAFTGLIVAAIALVAIVVGRFIDDGADERDTVEVDTEWDRVVTVNQHTGRVTMSDADGSGVEGLSTNTGRVAAAAMIGDSVHVAGGRASVAMSLSGDRPRLEISDLLDGDITIARPSGSTETLMYTNGSDAVFIGNDVERFIDTTVAVAAPGVELSLDEARTNVDGTAVLLPDPGNFQSVLLRFGDEPASYFAGVPLAVGADRVATAQNVGGSATVTLSDHEGSRLAEFSTQPVLAAMLIDGGILTVDRDGVIHLLRPSGDESVGSLDATPTDGWVTTTGDRLVVVTSDGVAVIDPDGEIRSSTPTAQPASTGPAPPSMTPLRPGCLPLAQAPEGVTLTNVRSGDLVAELADAGAGVLTSADGCTAIAASGTAAESGTSGVSAAGATVLSFDGIRDLANEYETLLALSPDGATIAVERAGRLVIEEVKTIDPESDDGEADAGDSSTDDPGEEPAGDLGAASPFVFFADL